MIKTKGQSAFEFLILVSIVVLFTVLIIASIQVNINDKTKKQKDAELLVVAQNVADEINLAYSSSDGYYRNFELRGYVLSGVKYNISLIDNFVYVYTLDNSSSLSIPAIKVIGNVVIGSNIIRKVNGSVYLN